MRLSGVFWLVLAATVSTSVAAAQTVSSAANQTFGVGNGNTNISTITITEDNSPSTTAANDIRVRIPAGFNMTWNTSLTTATIGGSDAGKVSTTVSYENGGQVLVVNVTTNFANNDQITISGLQFTNFTAASAADNLELVLSGSSGGPTADTDNRTKRIVVPSLSSAASQTFGVGNAATAMSTITVTDAASATITAANDIRIRIPTGFNMVWNTSLTTATIGGSDAGKVSTTVSYENGGQVLVVNVTTDFANNDQITISGLQFTNFAAASGADRLELVVSGSPAGSTADTDNRTKTIVAPTLSSAANQTFVVGNSATAMSTITITDASTATITAANDIRVRIPSGFNMTWNTSLTTATIGGSDAGKVSTTVSYENGGQVLVVNVTTNFANNDQITVSGLQFTNFTAPSAAADLELVTSGSSGGPTADADNRTKTIVAPTLSSAANQAFWAGSPATAMSAITITDASTGTITAANDLRVSIPAGFNMTWDATMTTATITGSGAARVSTTVTYANGNRTLVLNVTSNFVAGNQIVVSGLRFTNFTAASAINYLILEVGNNGLTTGLDDKSIQVNAPVYGASVTPDTVPVTRLPSNGTNYTAVFTVTNTGNASDSYDLLTTTPLTAISVISITGTGVTQAADPDSARLGSTAVGGSSTITVTYSVGNVGAGVTDTLILRARSVANSAVSDDGRVELTVVRPGVSVSKGVSPNGTQLPGTDLTYTVILTNAGSAAAAGVMTVDTLPGNVMFKVGSVLNTLPAGFTAALAYSNDGGSTWTYVPTSLACGAPAGFDSCVNRVRWTFTGSLSWSAPDNVATVEFISRIR